MIFPNTLIFQNISLISSKPWTIFLKISYFPQKVQSHFLFLPFSLDLEFSPHFYPACKLSKLSLFYLSLISEFSSTFQFDGIQSAWSYLSRRSHLLWGAIHVVLNIEPSAPDPSFPGGTTRGSKAFLICSLDHLSECGLKLASTVGKLTVNGNLIHAMVEQWNPRTCTFWFPWGEMTLLMDEFSEIMGLLEPAGQL